MEEYGEACLPEIAFSNTTYAVERIGEACLPKIYFFWWYLAAKLPNTTRKEDFLWRAAGPPNLPLGGRPPKSR
jgi:hypothetical protein